MKYIVIVLLIISIAGCDKYGVGGYVNRSLGNWAEVKLPDGCNPKYIAGEESSGVVVLCADGRVFH